LPGHVRLKLAALRDAQGLGAYSKKKVVRKSRKKSMFDGLYDALATRFETEDLEDWTLLLQMKDRQIKLRPETKSAYDQWHNLFTSLLPQHRATPMFEGWVWRRFSENDWRQRYAILHDGVIFYFLDAETSDMFKNVAVRMEDSMFIATPLAEATVNTEQLIVSRTAPMDDKLFVLNLKVDDPHLDEFISLVDDAQATAWMLAVRNARHWFESIADDHPTRRLFGGQQAEDDGPMLASNANPLASPEAQEAVTIRRSLFAKFEKNSLVADSEMLRTMFSEADADGSGELDFDELRALCSDKLQIIMTDQEWGLLVEALDQDHSGSVSFTEFNTWYLANCVQKKKAGNFEEREVDLIKGEIEVICLIFCVCVNVFQFLKRVFGCCFGIFSQLTTAHVPVMVAAH
jgi:hypothetical protein